ncbi:kinase-like domain-containing protein [Cyathus striatus]|nr:kinase-like domain-containing protein [Cyathus striatus]
MLTVTKVAIKCDRGVQHSVVPEDTLASRYMRELRIWRSLKHRHILPLYGRYTNDTFARYGALVSPFRKLGDIVTYLTENPGTNRLSIIQGVAKGLEYLHSQNVIHGDLKPRNIVMNFNSGEVYPEICDFGTSRVFGRDADICDTLVVTYRYMAPEIVMNEEQKGTAALSFEGDVYSMGMLQFEALTGDKPLNDMKNDMLVMLALHRGYRPKKRNYPNVPLLDECWPIMEKCWNEKPEHRCTARDIVKFLGFLEWPEESSIGQS